MGYGAGTNECTSSAISKGLPSIKALSELPEPIHQHMVRLAGIEPTTLGFGGQYSIH